MKKSRKKILLSSIAMLLVALVALGSATFAWFTISKTVTANEMRVQAITDAGLQISNTGASGTFTTQVSFNQTSDASSYQLKPVSWNGVTGTGFIPDGNVEDDQTGVYSGAFKAGASSAPSAAASGLAMGKNDNFAIYKVWVRSAAVGTPHNVEAKVTIEGANANFARVQFIDGSTKTIFADTAANNNSVVAAVGSNKTTYTTVAHNDFAAVTGVDDAQTPVEFDIIVWFDGEDANCIDSAQNAAANITLTFQASDM